MDIDAFEAKVRAGGKVTPCEAIKLAKHVREMEQRIGKGVAALSQELAEVKAERDALAASLARLKCRWQADGAESFKAELLKSTKTFIHPHIEGVHAVWLRRQAEEEK